MISTDKIKVWDFFIRFFHWSLVTSFLIAYITEDDFITIHSIAGYVILALISSRVVWGFIGGQYARFSSFVCSLDKTKQYIKSTFSFSAKRYIGHNPAGGLMIIIMIAILFLTTITGIILYGTENAGPLAGYFYNSSELFKDVLEGIHEFLANFTLLLIIIHVSGVLFESLIHNENLIKSMINGFKNK